jgi:hypothetical protein
MSPEDKKLLALLKKAVKIITGKECPCRKELNELGKKLAPTVGAHSWSGQYLYMLLNLDRFIKYYEKGQYRITEKILQAFCDAAGIESEMKEILYGSKSTQSEISLQQPTNKIKAETYINPNILKKLLQNIQKKKDRGYGQGERERYKPWFTAREVSSQGLTHRTYSRLTNRMHLLFSKLEKEVFLWYEQLPKVRDIREQFPLDFEETLNIAFALGKKHPTSPKTHLPIVMTSDFVITINTEAGNRIFVRSVKPSKELDKQRVLEKLEIERKYWMARNVDWAIITEKDLPDTIIENIQCVREYTEIQDRIKITPAQLLKQSKALARFAKKLTLHNACQKCDSLFGAKPGTSLTLAYHLIASRKWKVDMSVAIHPDNKLRFLAGAG